MTQDREKTSAAVRRGGAAEEPASETFAPLVDIYETADGTTYLLAELPGATSDSLDIRVDKGVLTLRAEARLPEFGEDYARTYTGFVGGEYFRAFALGDEVDREGIEASLENGLLTVRLPRAAAAATRKIEIR